MSPASEAAVKLRRSGVALRRGQAGSDTYEGCLWTTHVPHGHLGLNLGANCDKVYGLVIRSNNLTTHLASLDQFKGPGYERIHVQARLEDGTLVEAYAYELKSTRDEESH